VRAVITKPLRIINLAFTVDSSIKPIPLTDRYFTDSARTFEEQNHQPVENREKSSGRTGDGPPSELGKRLEVAVRAGRQQRGNSEMAAREPRESPEIPEGETRGSCAVAVVGSTEHASRMAGAQTGRASRQAV